MNSKKLKLTAIITGVTLIIANLVLGIVLAVKVFKTSSQPLGYEYGIDIHNINYTVSKNSDGTFNYNISGDITNNEQAIDYMSFFVSSLGTNENTPGIYYAINIQNLPFLISISKIGDNEIVHFDKTIESIDINAGRSPVDPVLTGLYGAYIDDISVKRNVNL